MNYYLSTNSLIDAIGTRSCYIKNIPELRNWNENGFRQFSTLTRFFLDLLMFNRRFSNCRPQNSAPYNPTIWQTVENTSFLEKLSYILQAFAKGYQGYKSQFWISRTFRPRNPANLGPIIRFWICRKEHIHTWQLYWF